MRTISFAWLVAFAGAIFSPCFIRADEVAGVTKAATRVTNTGDLKSSIPLQLPPGIAGHVPSLSIEFNSGGGNGLMGRGWSLAGSSRISRVPQTLEQDNHIRGVRFDNSDALALDGQRLMSLGAGQYRTEVESFSKIVASPTGFNVYTKEGDVLQYESAAASGSSQAYEWVLTRSEDRSGNTIIYHYNTSSDYGDSVAVLDYITYADNRIDFSYVARDDVRSSYLAGVTYQLKKRLGSVIVRMPGAPSTTWYSYTFAYDYSDLSGASVLRSIKDSRLSGTYIVQWPNASLYSGDAFPHDTSDTAANVPSQLAETSSYTLPASSFIRVVPTEGLAGKHDSFIFMRSTSRPSIPAAVDNPAGWSDVPIAPSGSYDTTFLWMSRSLKDYKGHLVEAWSMPERADARVTTYFQWSVTGASWHDAYALGDRYYRQKVGFVGSWSGATLVVGEEHVSNENFVFYRSYSQPSISATTTAGVTPSFWLDVPPAGTSPLWISVGTTSGYTTTWTPPQRMDRPTRSVYWSTYGDAKDYVPTDLEKDYTTMQHAAMPYMHLMDDAGHITDTFQLKSDLNARTRSEAIFFSSMPTQWASNTRPYGSDTPSVFSSYVALGVVPWNPAAVQSWGYPPEAMYPNIAEAPKYSYSKEWGPMSSWHDSFQTGDMYARQQKAGLNHAPYATTWIRRLTTAYEEFPIVAFKRSAEDPVSPPYSSLPLGSGWSLLPPTGTAKLWFSTGTIGRGASYVSGWTTPTLADSSRTDYQWGVSSDGPWHDNFLSSDKYIRYKQAYGTWSTGKLAVGEADQYTNYVFKRASGDMTGQPPTGSSHTFWYDAPPSGTDQLWVSYATFTGQGNLVGAWSAPEKVTAPESNPVNPDYYPQFQWTTSLDQPYHSLYRSDDKYLVYNLGTGWTTQPIAFSGASAGQHVIFRCSATQPSAPTTADRGLWSNQPPASGETLWASFNNTTFGAWGGAVQADKSPYGSNSKELQWSFNGSTNWHYGFQAGDVYFRYRIDNGAWIGPSLAVAEDLQKLLENGGVRFFDLNQDGYVDVLYSVDSGVEAYLSNKQGGWSRATGYDLDTTFASRVLDSRSSTRKAAAIYSDVQFVDLNADGLLDIMIGKGEERRAYLNTGSGWSSSTAYAPPKLLSVPVPNIVVEPGKPVPYTVDTGVQIVDVNGDGLADFVYWREGTDQYGQPENPAVYLNTGTGWATSSTTSYEPKYPLSVVGSGTYFDNGVRYLDINGDGLIDMLVANPDRLETYLNNGSGFDTSPTVAYAPKYPVAISLGGRADANGGVEFIDLNGDGLLDMLVGRTNAAGTIREAYLNTGTGWTSNRSEYAPLMALSNFGNDGGVRFHDLNGDGLVDFIYARSGVRGVHINTGKGWTIAKCDKYAPSQDFVNAAGEDTGFRMLDLNADGRVDALFSQKSDIHGVQKTYLNDAPPPDQVASFTDEFGSNSKADYHLLTNSSYYDKGAVTAFPVIRFIAPSYVVTSFKRPNGVGGDYETTYSYANGRYHLKGRGFLGFQIFESYDLQTGFSTIENVSHAFPWIGMSLQKRVYGSGMQLLQREDYTLDKRMLNTGRSTFPFISSVYVTDSLAGTSSTKSGTYDDFGNLLTFTTNYGSEGSVVTTNTYDNDTATWQIGLLKTSNTTATRTNCATVTTHASFQYYTNGLLQWTKNEPGTTKELKVENTYDVHGNVTAIKTTGSDIDERTETRTGYADNAYKFPHYVTNTLGHQTTLTYDARFGTPLTQTDANNLTTTFTYDALGRATYTDYPDNRYVSTSYTAESASLIHAVLRTTTSAPDQPTVTSYADRLGRVVQTSTDAPNRRSIVSHISYYANGQVHTKSVPRFEGYNAPPVALLQNVYSYNSVLQLANVDHPNGSKTSFGYSTVDGQRLVTVTKTYTDADDQVTKNYNNTRGELVKVIDAENGTLQTEFDAMGRVWKTIAPGSITTTHEYDIRGNQTDLYDPDAGHVQYAYNVLNELVIQTDAALNITQNVYDLGGRLISRTVGGETSHWYYDGDLPEQKKGFLYKVTGPAGYEKAIYYDLLSRPATELSAIEGNYYYSQYTYDSYSRLSTHDRYWRPLGLEAPEFRHLPNWNNYGVKYEYTDSYLTRLADRANHTLWQADAWNYDAFRRPMIYTYGNGVATLQTYDPATGNIEKTLSSALKEEYAYYNTGNLKTKTDKLTQASQTFTYDKLNRLTGTTIGSTTSQTNYDATGNIMSKDGLGYQYAQTGGAGPHAVTSAGGIAYTYDANGNLRTKGGSQSTVSWTAFNVPLQMVTGGTTTTFTYDADHGRITQTSVKNSEVTKKFYIDSGFEQTTNPDGHRETRIYLSAPSGMFAARTYLEQPYGYQQSNGQRAQGIVSLKYYHTDRLGSVAAITAETGAVAESYAFAAWGERGASSTPAGPDAAADRGYTGHETLGDHSLVHMNGRIYDPALGRMLSPDPLVSAPLNLQSYNRYAYVMNNPLGYTDPTGYSPKLVPNPANDYVFDDNMVLTQTSGEIKTEQIKGDKATNADETTNAAGATNVDGTKTAKPPVPDAPNSGGPSNPQWGDAQAEALRLRKENPDAAYIPAPQWLIGSPNYYVFRWFAAPAEYQNGKGSEYLLGFGLKNMYKFNGSAEDASAQYKNFVTRTGVELQLGLERILRDDPTIALSRERLLSAAYDSHDGAYRRGGFGDLSIGDQFKAAMVPDFSDSFGNGRAWKEIGQSLDMLRTDQIFPAPQNRLGGPGYTGF